MLYSFRLFLTLKTLVSHLSDGSNINNVSNADYVSETIDAENVINRSKTGTLARPRFRLPPMLLETLSMFLTLVVFLTLLTLEIYGVDYSRDTSTDVSGVSSRCGPISLRALRSASSADLAWTSRVTKRPTSAVFETNSRASVLLLQSLQPRL